MKTVILAGGLGSRLAEETTVRPKPMVEIGGWPILWHIMNIYAAHGHRDFLVACGYKGEVIKEWFVDYRMHSADMTVHLRDGRVEVLAERAPDWAVTLVDTGLMTSTGGRIKRMAPWIGGETFLATYGDGVGDVDVARVVEFHRAHGRLATLTAVRPPARFGGLEFEGDQVTRFAEKPQIGEGWINGGFMVLEPQVLDYIDGDDTLFEGAPMERLAADGQLMAYRHDGFWQPMDTLREKHLLEQLWSSGAAPWKVWRG
ncbi:MAG TPA: glucose-1-phosphate cytidylyltransferase [Longimicrobiaceae bacterium]|nr:glucose-1-phosphate cytidylyltransferase [Longimicrobiaceae bacterium]